MLKRESIATELWRRLTLLDCYTDRNPEKRPQAEDFPASLLFELDDEVTDADLSRKYPRYKRRFSFVVEYFVKGSSSAASSRELIDFAERVRIVLFAEPEFLNGLGQLQEEKTGRIVTVDAANHIKAAATLFSVLYAEDVADSFE